MTNPNAEHPAVRQVLVVLDTVSDNLSNMRSAVALAASLQAKLIGLFVEDTLLLQAVRSPVSREVMLWTARERNPDEAEMLRSLRALAALIQDDLAAAAKQASLKWSFRILRGSGIASILEAGANSDLLLMGTARRRMSRVSSHAPVRGEGGISLLYTGTAAARRALGTTLRLAEQQRLSIRLLVADKDPSALRQLREQLADSRLGIKLLNISTVEDEQSLIGLLCQPGTALLLIPADIPLAKNPASLQRLQAQASCPMVLVR